MLMILGKLRRKLIQLSFIKISSLFQEADWVYVGLQVGYAVQD